jgi:hypothetical protein
MNHTNTPAYGLSATACSEMVAIRLLKKQLKIDLVLVGRAVAWDVYLTGAPAGEAAERAGG